MACWSIKALERRTALRALATMACALMLVSCALQPATHAPLQTGESAPGFMLEAVRGGTLSFSLGKGPTLLSFVRAGFADDEAASASRSQIVFLKSMQQQYAANGLRVVLVASAVEAQPHPLATNGLLNFSYDWGLDSVPLLNDMPDRAVAKTYGIDQLPTTFLIDSSGLIVQRWNGFAAAAQLALAIQPLTNASMPLAADCVPTVVQTPFAGFGPARKLSPRIWLVDGGQDWTHTKPQPTTWLVFAGKQTPTLKVMATNMPQPLFDATLERLPDYEARLLLAHAPPDATYVYQLTTSLTLADASCVTLQAELMEELTLLERGEATLAVQ